MYGHEQDDRERQDMTEREKGNLKEDKGQKFGKNTFVSILDPEEKAEEDEIRPAFYVDLNLTQITDRISREWGEDISYFYRYMPANKAWMEYRREVYGDIIQPGCYESLCAFLEGMKAREDARTKKEAVRMELQKAFWLLREAACYCDAFHMLLESLDKIELHSEGMLAFTAFLREYLASERFVEMGEAVARMREQEDHIHLVLTYENDRITVAEGEAQDSYIQFLEEWFPNWKKKDMESPFGIQLNLTEVEIEILKVYQKRNPVFIREVEQFYSQYKDYAREELIRFSTEICFYLSFYCFERKMGEEGFIFGRPQVGNHKGESVLGEGQRDFGPGETDEILYAEGVYDLALACVVGKEREIVPNDAELGKGENFFVLTGPNQGGKTTYARSLGQLVYFAKMGLDVPAKSALMPYFSDIVTHFSVEESVETGRGKLKEELTRLAPLMDSVAAANAERGRNVGKEGCVPAFVVINELFTTAANYDACIMGKRVLEFFLGQCCMGIYVTHLKELAKAHPEIVSLRAMVDKEGGRTFEIARGEAADSASAADQVRKYGLTYEALKERLS